MKTGKTTRIDFNHNKRLSLLFKCKQESSRERNEITFEVSNQAYTECVYACAKALKQEKIKLELDQIARAFRRHQPNPQTDLISTAATASSLHRMRFFYAAAPTRATKELTIKLLFSLLVIYYPEHIVT